MKYKKTYKMPKRIKLGIIRRETKNFDKIKVFWISEELKNSMEE